MPGRAQMSAHSAQTSAGTRPARMPTPNSLQPTQYPKIDSSPAATMIMTSATSATPSAPNARAATAPIVVTVAPMPCAKHAGDEAGRDHRQQPVPGRGQGDDREHEHAAGDHAGGLLVDRMGKGEKADRLSIVSACACAQAGRPQR